MDCIHKQIEPNPCTECYKADARGCPDPDCEIIKAYIEYYEGKKKESGGVGE